MPKVAFESGAVEKQLPLDDIGPEILTAHLPKRKETNRCRSRRKLRVMVVDDTSVSRALIVDALDQMGVRGVVIAKDGAAALSALIAQPVHLVISDMNMPGLDGLGLLKGCANTSRRAGSASSSSPAAPTRR